MIFPPPSSGSAGERRLQQQLGTAERAARFYDQQVRSHLTDEMREFIGCQSMVFLATADSHGECDASFRAGPPGFATSSTTGRSPTPSSAGTVCSPAPAT